MRRLLLIVLCAGLCLAVFSCRKPDKNLVRIGSTVYAQEQFTAFQAMKGMYPVQKETVVFPGQRSPITEMVEIEVLFGRAPSSLQKKVAQRDDWKWKRIYFPAQKHIEAVWFKNKGFSDKTIESYYNAHREQYKLASVPTPNLPVDTTSKKGKTAKIKKTPAYRPLAEVRSQIVSDLFVAENPPDSQFVKRFAMPAVGPIDSTAKAAAPTTLDTAMMRTQWMNTIMSDFPMFFVKRAYKKLYNQPLPDSMNKWYGDGKYITSKDVETVLNWLPRDRRSMFESEMGSQKLRTFLLQWKVASESAHREGLHKTPEFAMISDWAWKKEVVSEYLDSVLIPQLTKQNSQIDSTMGRFIFWDQQNMIVDPVSSPQAFAKTIEQLTIQKVAVALDSAIYKYRQQRKVVFFQPDLRDEKGSDPHKMIARADSLRDAGNSTEAEAAYQKVLSNFSFLPQGDSASSELAKMQTEKGQYGEAIKNYRFCLLSGRSGGDRCKTMFMIGFIYDEYLNKPELAEVNYKWILKNVPDCELADDVEFMCLHLDEPMCSVEELQAQAKRQGRTLDEGTAEVKKQ